MVSIARDIPAQVLAELVSRDLWLPEKAEGYAAVIPDPRSRTDSLRALARLRADEGAQEDRTRLVAQARSAAAAVDSPMESAFMVAEPVQNAAGSDLNPHGGADISCRPVRGGVPPGQPRAAGVAGPPAGLPAERHYTPLNLRAISADMQGFGLSRQDHRRSAYRVVMDAFTEPR